MEKLSEKERQKRQFRVRIYKYILRLIKFLTKLPNDSVRREIKRQLTRSGTSIGANYFEATGASSKRDYQNFFSHSLKSANESKFWLAILRDSDLIPGDLGGEAEWLFKETKELADIFASSILTMKGKRR